MIRRLAFGLALALGLAMGAAAAPVEIGPDAMRRLAAGALAAENAPAALELSRALLLRDPNDPTALMLAAEAATLTGDWPGVADYAGRAHRLVEGPARFRAARLAAHARMRQGRFTQAQFWLRRASPDAPDAAALEGLARDYRAVAARNPLAFRLGFGVAPSSNVNGGSRAEELRLPGLPFVFELTGDAKALSGTVFDARFGVRRSIANPALPGPAWIDLAAEARLPRLSASARRQAPEAKGADYARATVRAAANQRIAAEAPIDLSAEVARHWYGGDPLVDTLRLGVARPLAQTQRAIVEVSLAGEYSYRHDLDAGWWAPVGQLGFSRELAGGDRLRMLLGLRHVSGERPDLSHDAVTLNLDHDLARPVGPARIGMGIEAQWRDYAATRYDMGGRQDRELQAELRVGLPQTARWSFYPELGLTARRSWSSVPLFEEQALTLELGLRSSF
ncbi:hypothetical protein FHS00_001744 [Limimaricola variabilis]|uniref:DUF560 domain-containing protein n=1 Tax=Limimaricola variabilis TaxID=1492771 RepID=A0ABR6HNW0_9RHOB|nr:hypothetical protein [Limimaricola variabilis]MBB3712167.1 hypothetical protein [Limimaricola variabilis]